MHRKTTWQHRILWAAAFGWAVVFVIVSYFLKDNPDTYTIFRRVHIEAVKLVWLSAGLVAGLVFERGEYLRRAWLLYACCPLGYLLYDVLYLFEPIEWISQHSQTIRIALTWLANGCQTIAVVMLASAWKIAGLDLPGAKWKRGTLRLCALALSLVLLGSSISTSIANLLKGQMGSLIDIAVALGDAAAMIYIAPLLLTYMALRGSLTSRPWIFFFFATLSWLVGSALYVYSSNTALKELTLITILEICRTFGSWYAFAAGLSQRQVILEARKTPNQ